MTPSDSLWHWVGWTAAAATLLLLLYAIVGDAVGQRFRRRRRCPKCWYDLSHTPGMTCSECGYTAGREGQLLKWRTRWRVIALTPVPWIGAYLWLYVPEMRQHGWIAGVPTLVLVYLTPPPEREGDYEDVPGSGRVWRYSPVMAEIDRRLKAGATLSPRNWRTLLTRGEFVWARDRWPIDKPIEIGVRSWPLGGALVTPGAMLVRQKGRLVDHNLIHGMLATGAESIWSRGDEGERVPLQGIELGACELEIQVNRWMTGPRALVTTLSIPITFVATIEEAIQPVTSPEIDVLVREHLRPQISCLNEIDQGNRWSWLNLDVSFIDDERMRGMAVQVEVDVLCHGEVIAAGLVDGHSAAFAFRREDDLIVLGSLGYDDLKAAPERYALRVRGSARRALRIASATSFWAGEIIIPCDQIRIEESFRQFDR